jgi:two-component system, NarL family, response regulator
MRVTDTTLRVVVADAQCLLHETLREVLEPDGFLIQAFARRGSEVLPLVGRHRPDVVLLEIDLPELDGIGALHRLAMDFPEIPAIVFAASGSADDVTAAFAAGARAYILKTVELEQLGATIRSAVAHAIPDPVGRPTVMPTTPRLTPRELEVLQLLAQGLANREIASELDRTEQTVKFHLTSIYRKLAVTNRTGAVITAIDAGIASLMIALTRFDTVIVDALAVIGRGFIS